MSKIVYYQYQRAKKEGKPTSAISCWELGIYNIADMADICVLSNKCFPSFNLDVFDDRNPNSEDDDEKYRR